MPLAMTTLPAIPICRTGHYELVSGPVDFSIEHLQAAVAAFRNDPAVLAPRVRVETPDAGHLDGDGIAAEAGGQAGGPALGWADNLAVQGNSLVADIHVPTELADCMEAMYPSRSIEGLFGYTTATGHTHDFMATGLLLLGQSWPGVSTLPDLHELSEQFAADVDDGAIDVPSYATATAGDPATAAVLSRSVVCARVAAAGRAPRAAREQFAAAGLNVADLRSRWYASEREGELTGLPESYDYDWWYVTEVRALDDGSLAVYVLDERADQEWSFPVTSVATGAVTFGEPIAVVRPDPVPVAAGAARPRPALARFTSRAESRGTTTSASSTTQEDHPMDDALRRRLAARHGLPEDATEADVTAAEMAVEDAPAEGDTPPEGSVPEGEGTDDTPAEGGQAPAGVTARTASISRERLDTLESQAAQGVAAQARQTHGDRDRMVLAALSAGRITPAESGLGTLDTATGLYEIAATGWRRDLEDAPEVTARALNRLEAGKYPGSAAARVAAPNDNGSNQTAAVIASIRGPENTERKVIHR